jgi:hypothetical protein
MTDQHVGLLVKISDPSGFLRRELSGSISSNQLVRKLERNVVFSKGVLGMDLLEVLLAEVCDRINVWWIGRGMCHDGALEHRVYI